MFTVDNKLQRLFRKEVGVSAPKWKVSIIFIDSDIVDERYWYGEDGGRQIFEDDTISCYLERGYGGSIGGTWIYAETTIYSLRLYNRPLNEDELKSNYDKTIAEHNIN